MVNTGIYFEVNKILFILKTNLKTKKQILKTTLKNKVTYIKSIYCIYK